MKGILAIILCMLSIGVNLTTGLTKEDLTKLVKTVKVAIPPASAPAPAWSKDEINCLARTIYGESRNQPFDGQVAVGAVVVTRSLHPKYPKDLCAVVQQKNQFVGYYAAPHVPSGKLSKAWETAFLAAKYATENYGDLPEGYRKIYFFTLRHENSKFHAKLPLLGYIKDHAFYGLPK